MKPEKVLYRQVSASDAANLAVIYNHFISNTHITFETETITANQMSERIAATLAVPLPWLVAELGDATVGYAYASRWKERRAYRYSVETTIYLAPEYFRKGVGLQLYSALLDELRSLSMHSALAVIALPNVASVHLHERLGFKKVGHLDQVGYKHERWIDVGYWQQSL
jgi:phosphinothricin acetyltransferase